MKMATNDKPPKADKPAKIAAPKPPKAKKKKGDDPDFIREEVIRVQVPLTDKEVAQKGRELAGILQEIANEEVSTELIKADIKQRMSALDSRRSEMVLLVSQGKEMRDVRCRVVVDKRNRNMVNYARCDSGEIVRTREITPFEKQRSLPLPKGGKKTDIPASTNKPDINPKDAPKPKPEAKNEPATGAAKPAEPKAAA